MCKVNIKAMKERCSSYDKDSPPHQVLVGRVSLNRREYPAASGITIATISQGRHIKAYLVRIERSFENDSTQNGLWKRNMRSLACYARQLTEGALRERGGLLVVVQIML